MTKQELTVFSDKIRLETLKQLNQAGFGHYGGSLSIVEVLAVLYGKWLRIDPENPKWPERDYLVLSKGHAGPVLYATLALKGFFDQELLKTLNQNGTTLPSHPDHRLVKGVDMTTGSLAQGLSVATGIALSLKLDKTEQKVYTIVGDGELNEGQCWEAIQFAAHRKLSNLVVFVDENKKQLDGPTDEVCKAFDFVQKFTSFGFFAIRVNGADVEAIDRAIAVSFAEADRPIAIILDTTKGQGVPLFEVMDANHHVRLAGELREQVVDFTTELETALAGKEGF